MSLCGDKSPFDFGNSCVRASWGALVPGAFVFALCVFSIPIPKPIRHLFEPITRQFRSFLTLQEAEALDAQALSVDRAFCNEGTPAAAVHAPQSVSWRTVVFAFVGTVETLWWLAHGSYLLYDDAQNWWRGTRALIFAVAWLYTVVRPIARPTATPPYDVFVIYLLLLGASILELGGFLYDRGVYGDPLPSRWPLTALWVNLAATVGMLGVVFRMPLALPSERVKEEDIGRTVTPEDYTTLWGWVTFWWVYPLVKKGRNTTLSEDDVWDLSPTQQSRPVFVKFSQTKRPTLLRRLWAANSLDLTLDFCLTLVSVSFNYCGPFFLKRILDEIDHESPTRANKSKAYIYAFLAFLCTLCKAQADVQHLWFGRRAGTHIRSELMASIYDKALKRKDYSGIVDKDKVKKAEEEKAAQNEPAKKKSKAGKKAEKERAAKADDPKAGADVGKIVNLMAGDANRICQMVSGAYFLYGAPFEIVIASVFLYQLLGMSAFAGFAILLIGWPLNNFLSRRAVRIHKGVVTARDKRMGVLNELIGAVKFIKFFAWEERWIQRALDARENEMKWMVKARFNSVMFYFLWTCAPIFVSIISFFTYVVRGNNLTISTAFTAIALFGMIRAPLNVIPAWIVQILQTGIAMKRISVYLDEEEVSEQVSSLKKDNTSPHTNLDPEEDGLGFVNASFKWNEVPEDKESDAQEGNGKGKNPEASTSSGTVTVVDDTSTVASGSDIASVDFTAPDVVGEDHRFELRDLNIRFPEGELTVVTGPTASGKTALLMALLGEMTITAGKIIMHKDPSRIDSENGLMHAISYAAQSPWLRHQSIKDNILFGYPYDEERYKAVVEACALNPDLEMLEDGDETEIGARGVSLSGGQKARVAFARAVYARTKYVLLDDPLSAVDSHTSRFLYEHLLRGPLLADRTVILVTHHVELVLPGAYYLVRMLDGRIDTHGTVKDLRAQGILDHITHDAEVEAQKDQAAVVTAEEVLAQVIDSEAEVEAKKPRKLIKDEHRETGGVKWRIYNSYLKASSYWTWGILGAFVVFAQLLGFGEKFWIKTWGEAYGHPDEGSASQYVFRSFSAIDHEIPMDGYPSPHHQHTYQSIPKSFSFGISGINWPPATSYPYFYIGIYAAIGFANALTNVLSVTTQYTGALRASRILFKKLLVTVVRATFRFHDTTPQGRMLNRFGKDIETIDTSLAGSLQAVNSSLASFFAAILAVTFVFPSFLIPAFFIGFAYRELAIGYLNTGRDLRRMESNSRSPIFSDFGELLEGIVTVRAFSAENRFLNNLHRKIDVTTKMWYSFWMTNRWLLLNFDALGGLAVLVTTLFSITTLTDGAGWAGLCITSAMAFTTSVYWACRFWTALELDLNSVERVVEYLDLPQEPPAIIESNRAPAYWPSSSGNDSLVVVENLTIKYSPELPAVLQDVSFRLKAGERVGLLGRTGSGKSTLAMSILRFVDPASGKIIIDGIDISTIGVHDLRSRITFIPQDATLFSGTLRDNLDPFNEHTDAECLDVLQRVQMIGRSDSASTSRDQSAATTPGGSRAPSIHNISVLSPSPDSDNASSIITSTSTPTEIDGGKTRITLDTQVSAGGTNFSQGQRQLIAMARALLRRSSIIVLDEATSSIDFATDAKIQQTIREEFTDSLLLTVAHRLKTVIDYDRLIVLDKGQISEFDTPWNLIQKEDGIFRNMCLKSGSFTELEAIAKSKVEGLPVTA
ncbi:multidrug resistance-associated ABC transporter [Macrolepiota fuliginosa MF-IS2]|uniref:Multidrug resistance-associated ABC transporter n=1 Tax=Macrolepiota fuliginosa MF-IS2 TaxID=1400762 RepID=A0A9P5X3I5_9AGAR|nr:multidrug resistance-associated ABC transporter [Macrolepiota fuliginosa MF-IS2]